MRIPLTKLLALLIAAVVILPATPAMAQEEIVVTGSGWGHGIGLPQYGAKGQAEEGRSAGDILGYYYTGTVMGTVGEGELTGHAEPLRIGVSQKSAKDWFYTEGGPITVCLGFECHIANEFESWTVTADGLGNCWLTRNDAMVGVPGACDGEIRWEGQPGVRVVFPVLNRTYARGKILFEPAPGNTYHVVVEIGLEEYLYGLGEMPSSWHAEALKAQAIAGRSFALYKAWIYRNLLANEARMDACGCHLYASTLDQKYIGWAKEAEGNGHWGTIWRKAVNDTKHKALYHPSDGVSRAIEAYYFSSSGGATENNEEVWGGKPYSYLRSQADPWSTNAGTKNPNDSWTFKFTPGQVAAAFGFSSVYNVSVIERNTSDSARTVQISGFAGGVQTSINVTAASFRSKLGLKSQYFSVNWGGIPPFPGGADRPVLHDPTSGQWFYWSNDGIRSSIYYGNPGDHAFMGDWNCDGIDTPGLYRRSDGFVYLRNSNTQGISDISYFFGNPGDLPIAGDFNGNGCDTVSIYRPSEARFYIINTLGGGDAGLGHAEYSYLFGVPGDIPFVGDWNGNGIDTPGLRRNSNGFVYLRNTNTQGVADIEYFYGDSGDLVFAGDWDANGTDTLGLYRPSNGWIYLRNSNSTGVAHLAYQAGGSVHKPVAGAR